ncbi:hypothetical protein FB451DRAFT_1396030 [Mycena latifolia]|nr:hypothetical protein FB451DRAFT_1396030 [Mycena latifolia]
MKLTLALLAPFIAVAFAKPIADATARSGIHCDIFGFICSGGIDQQEFCMSLDWQCQGMLYAEIAQFPDATPDTPPYTSLIKLVDANACQYVKHYALNRAPPTSDDVHISASEMLIEFWSARESDAGLVFGPVSAYWDASWTGRIGSICPGPSDIYALVSNGHLARLLMYPAVHLLLALDDHLGLVIALQHNCLQVVSYA